ncbi:ABC-type sugar transport system, periplasmic component [Opitutaceae bacterium TAV1]|nr:sugar ABC transporter substrate-binding protein [Opitutaceae bacterium TAV5]EIP98730.1 ABC-type sugar transport system, periplasmic component [Opitutaceae bacterium TAV1]
MKTLRYLLAGLCIAGLSLLAVSPALAAPKRPLKIGLAVYGLRGEFMKMLTNWVQDHPAVKNGDVRITVFDGRYDPNVQNDQFDSMIVQQFDGIIFVPIDYEAGSRSVEKAVAEGIPVVGSNTRISKIDLLAAYVGNNDVRAGEMEAQSVVDRIGGKGNVVIIEGPIGQSAQIERRKGNLNVLQKYPDIKVLDMKPGNWDRALALSLMENWLTAYPGKINGVIGQNDDLGLGAIQAIKAAGLKVSDFAVVGVDGIKDAFAAARAGEIVSVLQDSKAQGQGALDVLLRHIIGPEYKPQSDIWEFYGDRMPWNGGNEKHYDIPWTLITAQNADSLARQVLK